MIKKIRIMKKLNKISNTLINILFAIQVLIFVKSFIMIINNLKKEK